MSTILDAIERKKSGKALDDGAIAAIVEGFVAADIPDYQMAALLMAITLRGMTYAETLTLTRVMANSGTRYSFPDCVDKHSTGGVGDKVTLTALPLVAACGVPVAKLSGRGLGTTGGTIDKLEAIPGFEVGIDEKRFRRQVEEVGMAIGEAGELAPADKAIYALRDVTGTVESLPLIGSSIVSKKAATGCGHLLYDVKRGSGAFMKSTEQARELAELLVRLSEAMEITAAALITEMNTPLGAMIGNALEVRESVAFLRGEDVRDDLAEVALEVATRLLELREVEDAAAAIARALQSGAGYEKLAEMVAAQGGDADALADLPVSGQTKEVEADRDGYVCRIDALGVARAALALGAGRQRKDDRIDPGAGVELLVPIGARVSRGDPLARLYGARGVEDARRFLDGALALGDEAVEPPPHVVDRL